jgi:hypothetical protein
MLQKACKEIVAHGLDDTFYVVDLANVLRMYKVMTVTWLAGSVWVGSGWEGGSPVLECMTSPNRCTAAPAEWRTEVSLLLQGTILPTCLIL